MSLEIDHVPGLVAVGGMKEVIESNFEQRRQRRVSRKMPADARVFLILAMDHSHRIPAKECLDAGLYIAIARIGQLLLDWNRVPVRSIQLRRRFHAGLARATR